jgi:hypothetical protein
MWHVEMKTKTIRTDFSKVILLSDLKYWRLATFRLNYKQKLFHQGIVPKQQNANKSVWCDNS